ncbi:MAG: ribonuclease HII [Patescibacteria group bacterium UBA2163]
MNTTARIIIGIDEVGRGPIAGPVMVAAVGLNKTFSVSDFPGINDSKKLTPKKRDTLRAIIDERRERGELRVGVHAVPANDIDEKGIVPALELAVTEALTALAIDPKVCDVRLDGSLKAPIGYVHQQTIIKGDQKELSIMLASVFAKTERDREMERHAIQYPEYGFERHKGYGTKAHYEAITLHGACPLHRKTWLKTKTIT